MGAGNNEQTIKKCQLRWPHLKEQQIKDSVENLTDALDEIKYYFKRNEPQQTEP